MTSNLQDEFFYLATQYYAIGKFAMSASLDPVSGILFHHALELYLKGALSLRMDETKRRDLGHQLHALWSEFKNMASYPELAKFDGAVKVLQKFEEIRYPERIVRNGMRLVISLRPIDSGVIEKYDEQSAPHYVLPFDQMDSLIRIVIGSTGKDPEYVFGQIAPRGYAEIKKGFELTL